MARNTCLLTPLALCQLSQFTTIKCWQIKYNYLLRQLFILQKNKNQCDIELELIDGLNSIQ